MSGFTDLRPGNNSSGNSEDSVWPSFTDIMSVIMMIFLMSLAVILIRNTELVESLQATLNERDSANKIAEETSSTNTLLEAKISQIEEEILLLKAQLLQSKNDLNLSEEQRLSEIQKAKELSVDILGLQNLRDRLLKENTQINAKILELNGKIKIVKENEKTLSEKLTNTESKALSLEENNVNLLNQLTQLNLSIDNLTKESKDKASENEQLQIAYENIQIEKDNLASRASKADEIINQLKSDLTSSNQQLTITNEKLASTSEELVVTQDKFVTLEEKYLKLVGPARSEINKIVTNVRVNKVNNNIQYEFKAPDANSYESLSLSALESKLSGLKDTHADKLYVKIIIPENSTINHNEAWKITNNLLQKYDYYYQ